MKKILFFFTALMMVAINATRVSAQTEAYTNGNATILQHTDGWQVLHGTSIVAHGDGVLDVKNLPPAFQDFLDYYAKLPLDKTPRKSLSKNVSPTYGPLIKTQWHQDSPYNDLCPELNGKHAVTGCTTIASAQLMNFYGYCLPFNISGTTTTWYEDIKSEYISNVTKIEYSTSYDYNYSYTPDFDMISKDEMELAKFIVGIAFAQEASFGIYSTSTNPYNQLSALQELFGYICESYDISSLDDRSLIADAIKKGMPVLISGYQGYDGHSFIIDGYNGTEYHVNYGWGGNSDGWFSDTQYPENNMITIARPNYENFTVMQSKPQLLHVVGNGIDKTIAMVQSGDNLLSYKQGEEIELAAGEYEFYFEYDDGSKIAPYVTSAAELEKGFTTYGRFATAPAKIKLGKSYKVDFCHTVSSCEIKVFCSDLQVSISGKVLDEDNKPIKGAIVATSNSVPTCEALQKNENEIDWVCALPYFSAKFVPTKPYLTQVDFIAFKEGNPNELVVSIQNVSGNKILEKSISAETIGYSTKWLSVEMDSPLPVTIGDTYYFVIENPDNDVTSDNYFRIANDSDHNLLYRVWSSDYYFTKTDSEGNYKFIVDKHSSGNLYAFYDKTTFEPLSWDNIQNSSSEQDFNGLSTVVTVSGKVINFDGKAIKDAIVSLCNTKPELIAEKKSGHFDAWYYSYQFRQRGIHSNAFQLQKKYIDAIEIYVDAEGNPGDLTVGIEDNDGNKLWQKSFTYDEISDSEWIKATIDGMLEIVPGEDYYITYHTTESDENNKYYYFIDENNDLLFNVWTSDERIAHTDDNGCYSFKVDRYSTGDLYAYNDKNIFEPVSWNNIQNSTPEQNFNGISTEVTISGKVLDKNSRPVIGAYVSTSETKPQSEALQKNDNESEIFCIFSSIAQEFVATRPYITKVDFSVWRYGNPKELTVSIQNDKDEVLWQKTLQGSKVGNSEWETVELESPLSVNVGNTYYLVLTDPYSNDDNYFRCCKDKDWNMLYRIWSSEYNYVKTDREGNYAFITNRYSSATLHAFFEDKNFNEISLVNIEDNVSGQDFIGDFETPVSELSADNITVIWSSETTIYIQNPIKEIRIADLSGHLVKTIKATADRMEIPMPKAGIYIVKTGTKTQKVMIR